MARVPADWRIGVGAKVSKRPLEFRVTNFCRIPFTSTRFHMRQHTMKSLLIVLLGCLAAACASQTPADGQASPALAVNAKSETKAPVAAPTMDRNITSEKILAMQRQGYKIINQDGETYFCRREVKTGTHLPGDIVCITEKEAAALREETQRRLEDFSRQVPPPQGN
jgi:hypothetical protein